MVGIRDDAGHYSYDGEGVDLEMSVIWGDLFLG